MTQTKTFKFESSLRRKMAIGGGQTIADAISLADKALMGHQASAMQSFADSLVQLEAACATRDADGHPRIYELAAALVDMAGFFETGPLYTAAFSLCELSDRLLTNGIWDWPSIEVHVRSIRLILKENCRQNATTIQIVEGLAAVTRVRGCGDCNAKPAG